MICQGWGMSRIFEGLKRVDLRNIWQAKEAGFGLVYVGPGLRFCIQPSRSSTLAT